jgi:hypothetical protein
VSNSVPQAVAQGTNMKLNGVIQASVIVNAAFLVSGVYNSCKNVQSYSKASHMFD